MATLDEIRLQQLLAPFNNQTGIMTSSNAIPMINNIPMINTGMIDQKLQNTDLINQLIEQNKIANMNKFGNTIAPLGNTQQIPLLPTDDTASFFFPPENTTNTTPSKNLGIDTFYGVANEPDVEEDTEEYEVDKFGYRKKPSGIAKLFEFLGNIPTPFNLIRRGLGSLKGLNDKIQSSDFGQATSLMDYLDMKKYGGLQKRNDAAARNMAQARGITKSLASKPSSTSGGYQHGPGGSGAQNTGASNKGSGGAYSSAGKTGAKAGFGYGL